MAFNPFLSMNEPAAPVGTEELNPFMMSDAEPVAFDNADNPFAVSNPFSDFGGGGYDPPVGDTVPVDIFGGAEPTGIGAKQFVNFEADATMGLFGSQPVKPTELELITTTADTFSDDDGDLQPPSRPLPPETQNLILSVTGQMEFNSSHLLDRIPLTRTPSPVSVRDIHSPSPTPDPEMDLEPQEEPAPVVEHADTTRAKPARPPVPPPARPPLPPPPPRPAPPPVSQMPQRPPPPQTTTDEINLFDAPTPVVIKPTKEAILSLYSAPKKEEKQIDFLSDDIMDSMSAEPATEHPIGSTAFGDSKVTETAAESIFVEEIATSDPPDFSDSQGDIMFPPPSSSPQQTIAPMDCSEPATEMTLTPVNNTSPFAESVADDFQTQPEELENNPFESGGALDTTTAFVSPGANIFGIDVAETTVTANNVFGMDSDSFGTSTAATTMTTQANIFGTNSSPFDDDNLTNAFNSGGDENIFGVSQPATSSPFDDNNHADDFGVGIGGHDNVFGAGQAMTSSPFDDNNQGDAFGSSAGGENIFGVSHSAAPSDQGWGDPSEAMVQDAFPSSHEALPESYDAFPESQDAFDAFSAKFDSTAANHMNTGAWGEDGGSDASFGGFEAEAFDTFLNMGAPPPPAATPRLDHEGSRESTDDTFSVFIRPKDSEVSGEESAVPALAPPPRPQAIPESPRVNPFDKSGFEPPPPQIDTQMGDESRRASGSETPPTPLFDEDVSQPLEEFPRVKYNGPGWEMHLRQPNKKKITGQRFWKKIFVRLALAGDNPVVQLLNAAGDKEPFQELPLQACYSVSEVGAQQFDQFGKIFTVKLQYVFYKERPGVRPGQVTKAERITNKLSQFAAYAIQGDYQGVKEFGSDLRKLGLPVEHAPQVSQLFKIGSLCFEDVKQFSCCVEEALFRLSAHRDRALAYKMEEVQITAVDELYVEQDAEGSVHKQIARVRVFFIGFLCGMPDVELGVNDLRRQGKEVVGRHDIIPVVTEEWIRVEAPEFHACVQPEEFDASQIIKFKPPDACYIELMRFRIRPPKNRELPLQLKAVWCVTGNKVELRADVLVPGFASRKLGQVPCEDVCIRFPIPECWIYLFRVEKHFRYGSVKSAHRRTGKIKGIERFLGAVDNLQESLIEVTSGQAKYEHQHRAIVWRMPRLPKEGQGAYTTHNLVCRMALTSYDQIPAELAPHAHVEFTMPATTASHVTVRSVSLQNHDRDDPPEKYVRYLARHEYIVGIERTSGQSAPAYAMAAKVDAPPASAAPAAAPPAPIQPPSSDSDSD